MRHKDNKWLEGGASVGLARVALRALGGQPPTPGGGPHGKLGHGGHVNRSTRRLLLRGAPRPTADEACLFVRVGDIPVFTVLAERQEVVCVSALALEPEAVLELDWGFPIVAAEPHLSSAQRKVRNSRGVS